MQALLTSLQLIDRCTAAAGGMSRLQLFSDGFLFSSDGMLSNTCRYSASVLIALEDRPFEVVVGQRVERCHAVAVKPLVLKTVRAQGVPFICLDLSPQHPHYRALHALGGDGVLVVPRTDLAELMPDARAFHEGRLDQERARVLLDRAMAMAARRLPRPRSMDPRVERVMADIAAEPQADAARARALACLSRHRLSHLFSLTLGISMRHYAQAMKLHLAARYFGSPLSVTQIAHGAGFADLPHFSKVFSRCFGYSPQTAYRGGSIALHPLPDHMRPLGRTARRHGRFPPHRSEATPVTLAH